MPACFTPALRQLALALLLALALPLALASTSPSAAQAVGGPRLLVDSGDTARIATLRRQGATLLADYGPFSLWRLPRNSPAAREAQEDERLDAIYLRGITLDTSAPAASARERPAPGQQLWMLQLVGPARDAWLDELRQLGLTPVAYLPTNAYLIWGESAAIAALDGLVAEGSVVAWHGPYLAAYRLAPRLRSLAAGDPPARVAVQVVAQYDESSSVARLAALGSILRAPTTLSGLTTIGVELPAARVAEVAGWPEVVNVEPLAEPRPSDERQGQIIAGNLQSSGGGAVPSGAGYLSWLSSKGFPTDPARYPIVEVTDDGLDGGDADDVQHPDFYERGDPARADRVVAIDNCTRDASGSGPAGHGNLNAGIVAAYNNATGAAFADSQGYRYGLGIAPFARLASTKIFRDNRAFDLSACGAGDFPDLIARGVAHGAAITSNSWADTSSSFQGVYDVSAQQYDALTRDAAPFTPGAQPQLHIFAAGNAGPAPGSVGTPGTAKNVLTVGATENVHADGFPDGCGYTGANNADDIASFSARGATDDGRAKPDLVAPGLHVSGPASQPTFNGDGVCGPYYPSGQTLYTWSSGTSHSAPAVAGAAALLHELYGRALAPGEQPSPAMLKALLLNSARYLQGNGTGDTLPSPSQGWGGVSLAPLVAATPRELIDQSQVFGETGETFVLTRSVASASAPLRVTLVWTDTPGATTAARALVNNLDLEVSVGGALYRGNVFQGGRSVTGDSADILNNVEQVLLPAGVSGPVTIRIVAANIAGNALPGNLDTSDQDFALVVSNVAPEGSVTPSATATATATPTSTPTPTRTATPTASVSTPVRPTREIFLPSLLGG